MRLKTIIFAVAVSFTFGSLSPVCGQTFLVDGREVPLESTQEIEGAQWISTKDLQTLTGFTIKPEGACIGEICVPINDDVRQQLIRTEDGKEWIQLDLFLETVNQPVAKDNEERVWSLGRRVDSLANYKLGVADDFELRDRSNKLVRLSDYRGKKVIIFTWASW
ncbi:MAG: hypothetical protein MPJ50_04350 [Pirellulales bacterium]|nr:hypothetical protein [Pirellulales bacterium]